MSIRFMPGARALGLGLALVVALFATYVWPTAYRELHTRPGVLAVGFVRAVAVREHRFTGRIDVLTSTGWQPLAAQRPMAALDSIARAP